MTRYVRDAEGNQHMATSHRTYRNSNGQLYVDYSDTPRKAQLEMELRDQLENRGDLLVRRLSTAKVDARIAELEAELAELGGG